MLAHCRHHRCRTACSAGGSECRFRSCPTHGHSVQELTRVARIGRPGQHTAARLQALDLRPGSPRTSAAGRPAAAASPQRHRPLRRSPVRTQCAAAAAPSAARGLRAAPDSQGRSLSSAHSRHKQCVSRCPAPAAMSDPRRRVATDSRGCFNRPSPCLCDRQVETLASELSAKLAHSAVLPRRSISLHSPSHPRTQGNLWHQPKRCHS